MNIKIGFAAFAAALTLSSFGDASLSQVVVRQQWPWSTKINVDFTLANETGGAVDVTVVATNGNAEVVLPDAALSGNRFGLSSSGNYRIVIDPAKLNLGAATVFGDFKVSLSVAPPSRADYDDVLYRIYALDGSSPARKDVTVADLLNGKYGDYETDYSYANGGVWNPANVLIWTGVTNNLAYKTTHLVMRKVPHGSFTMCEYALNSDVSVTLTKDYFIGVFEMTQKQCDFIYASKSTYNHAGDTYPADKVNFNMIRGYEGRQWPEDQTTIGTDSYLYHLRSLTGNATFDLPTEARWEYACRAGSTKHWNNGEDDTTNSSNNSVVPKIGRSKYSSPDVEHPETAEVGSYLPNAWGLYDMHGNVIELCLDVWSATPSISSEDPVGPTAAGDAYKSRVAKGGYYSYGPNYVYVDARQGVSYNNTNANYTYGGFRVICEAGE